MKCAKTWLGCAAVGADVYFYGHVSTSRVGFVRTWCSQSPSVGASTKGILEPHGSLLLGAEGVCSSKVGFPLALLTLFGQTLAVESLFYMAPGVVPTLT